MVGNALGVMFTSMNMLFWVFSIIFKLKYSLVFIIFYTQVNTILLLKTKKFYRIGDYVDPFETQ